MAAVASCPHSNTLQLPKRGQSVHKDECTQCFDDDQSLEGINVCLTCFNGGCAKPGGHSERHHSVTQHPIVLNVRKTISEPAPESTRTDSEPPTKITKLGLNVAGGINTTNAPLIHYHTRVHCLTCGVDIIHQSDNEREQQQQAADAQKAAGETATQPQPKNFIDQIVDAVLLASSASAASVDDSSWEEKPQPCEHTLMLNYGAGPLPQIKAKGTAKCSECDLTSNLWLCLTCGKLHCGRAYSDGTGGNGHAVQHHKSSGHPVVVKMGTISAEGTADLFCYTCDNSVIDPELVSHLSVFGIDMSQQEVTEKTTAELELDANLNHNWSVVLNEGGTEAQLKFGPGNAGLRNLGNSCYMASVIQSVFHLPEFKARYFDHGQEHIASCTNSSPADCFLCQMSKIGHAIYSGRYAMIPSEEDFEVARVLREHEELEKQRAKRGDDAPMDIDEPHKPRSNKKKQVRFHFQSHRFLAIHCCDVDLLLTDSCCDLFVMFSSKLVFLLACSSV